MSISLVFLLTILGFADSVSGYQDPAITEALADTLYSLGEFDGAALEYKRALYHAQLTPYIYYDSSGQLKKGEYPVGYQVFSEDEDALLTQVKLSLSLWFNGELDEADSILYSLEGSSVRMIRAVLLIQEDNPYLAALAVDSTTREVMGAKAYEIRGWAYFEARDFWNAAREFKKAGKDSLGLIVGELSDIRLKNPRIARWLSIIPGLGEAYAGRPLFGLWALAVNAGDTYLIVDGLLDKRYLDAFLVYTFLWQRFWAGSMANASRFTYEWNERKLAEVMNPIRDEFEENAALNLDLHTLIELYQISQSAE